MSEENPVFNSINDLVEPGKITGVLVKPNLLNEALASALHCDVKDIPPLVSGDQRVTINEKEFRIINWVETDSEISLKESYPDVNCLHMAHLAAQRREIMKVNIEVCEDKLTCILLASYDNPSSEEMLSPDIKINAPIKAVFLTGNTVIVKDNREVQIVRQSLRHPTSWGQTFKI